MNVEDEGSYRFHIKPGPSGRGRLTTNDDPYFQVSFGRRSAVFYRDPFNELSLGAIFETSVAVSTDFFIENIAAVPPGLTKEDYARLILHRIRAAGTSGRRSVVFTGPLGDPQPA